MTDMALRCRMRGDTGAGLNAGTDVKVPLISKVAYGMGDVGCNFSWMFVGNFLMIFYTDVFGISMGAVAGLMLFSRFWDAVNDPIIGSLTDRTHSRWGRYRPWLLAAAPLTAIVLILTFWAHPGWNSLRPYPRTVPISLPWQASCCSGSHCMGGMRMHCIISPMWRAARRSLAYIPCVS